MKKRLGLSGSWDRFEGGESDGEVAGQQSAAIQRGKMVLEKGEKEIATCWRT